MDAPRASRRGVLVTPLLFCCLLAAGTQPSRAGVTDPDVPDSRYIEFGKKFPFVFQFHARVRQEVSPADAPKPVRTRFGSAVAIAPHWALTVAHATDNTEQQYLVTDKGRRTITKIIQHKNYDPKLYGHYDIALAYSPEDFGLEFYTPLQDTNHELGKPVTLAGYGRSGTFVTGAIREQDGQRRAGSNVIYAVNQQLVFCSATIAADKTALELLTAPGDSGGGLFIGNQLAGIAAFVMAPRTTNPHYAEAAAFTRVSFFADWVKSEIANAERELP